ncbi:50S ribosomal protein L18 [Candidatus Desantisbacteria bacterium]|nr:50S ribosomal protein L18 [Candidatus Desantisbacteria bacterium]
MRKNFKELSRKKRHLRVRKKISGNKEIPRLNVFRSTKYIYAQLIDDVEGRVLVSASTLNAEMKKETKSGKNISASKLIGAAIAQKAIDMGIKRVVFDKGGFLYHGRIKALADAAREKGLTF